MMMIMLLTNTVGQSPLEVTSRLSCQGIRASYGIRWFIIVFTKAHHWSLSWFRCIQSPPSHLVSL